MALPAFRGRRHRTLIGLAASATLLTTLVVVPPGNARPADECARMNPAADNFAALCRSEAELTATDDSGATLPVDAISSSPNLRQVANLPKQAPFDTTPAFNTDLAFQGRYAFGGNYNGF